MNITTIKRVVKHIRSSDLLSMNEAYNQSVLGFRTKDYILVMKVITSEYGIKSNWPKTFNYVEIQKGVNDL